MPGRDSAMYCIFVTVLLIQGGVAGRANLSFSQGHLVSFIFSLSRAVFSTRDQSPGILSLKLEHLYDPAPPLLTLPSPAEAP